MVWNDRLAFCRDTMTSCRLTLGALRSNSRCRRIGFLLRVVDLLQRGLQRCAELRCTVRGSRLLLARGTRGQAVELLQQLVDALSVHLGHSELAGCITRRVKLQLPCH